MAAKIEFRQQCPSCEAQVPIKDRKLVGRKIDCPKCKYRFVVEDPEAEVEEEEEAPAKKGKGTNGVGAKRPGKAKGKQKPEASKSKLYIGLGLGAVALVLLVVCGYILFGPDNSIPKPNPNPNPNIPGIVDGKEKDKPPQPVAVNDPTNLLPGNTQRIASLHAIRALDSALNRIFFETPGAYSREAFRNKFGFGVDDVRRVVLGRNDDETWDFNVLTTAKPINLDDLKKRLGLKEGAKKAIHGIEYFAIEGDLDSLSKYLFNSFGKPMGLYQADNNTLVLATLEPLEAYLEATKGKPTFRTQPAGQPQPVDPKPADGPKDGQPKVGQIGQQVIGDAGLLQQGQQPQGQQQPDPNQQGGQAQGGSQSYLTVSPALKGMMDLLEDGKEQVFVIGNLPGKRAPSLQELLGFPLGIELPAAVQKLRVHLSWGLAVEAFKVDKAPFVLAAECKTEEEAKKVEALVRPLLTPEALKEIEAKWGGMVVLADEQGNIPAGIEIPDDTKVSKVVLSVRDKTFLIKLELAPSKDVITAHVNRLAPTIIRDKGRTEMTSNRSRLPELASALKTMSEKTGRFPPGTLERKPPAERAGLPWRPDQRLSWMVELLPYLGQREFNSLYIEIETKKEKEISWRDPENALAAATLVPYFLARDTPETLWWVQYPGAPGQNFAATHFVGISGVGLDSADADFATLDPNWQKKIGIFGYERSTKLDEIKDGLANTIAVIQVPPQYKTPWLAGGGSTVRGVPESESVRPFVCAMHNDKDGTFAIMADGAVRFIPEDISDDDFKALCTINGGEKIANLDAIAPLIAGPGVKTELKPMVPPEKPIK